MDEYSGAPLRQTSRFEQLLEYGRSSHEVSAAVQKVAETHHEGFLDMAKAKLLDLLLVQLEEPLSRGAYPSDEPEPGEDDTCLLCTGTGIPQLGPPDVGRCSACGGGGVRRREPSEDGFDL